MQEISIAGCGYLGLRLAQRLLRESENLRGYAKRPERLSRIASLGAEAVHLDLDQPVPGILDLAGRWVYYLVPPAPSGNGDVRLARFLDRVAGSPRRFIYMSTTGVYGDRTGQFVSEDAPVNPSSERAIRRLSAENAVRAWAESRAVSWCILRVPAIYGPDRLPLERLRRGDPAISYDDASPGNRIHVEDLVSACVAAARRSAADRRVYNITDGTDDSATAFLARVARIAGLPMAPLVTRAEARNVMSETAWSFLSESRRADNRRMLDELGVKLAFSDLDAGIRASLQPA